MTIADWCIFGAIMIALLTLAPVKPLAGREFDNSNPRNPNFYQSPVRRRVLGAHNNGLETFAFFAASVLLAEFRIAPQVWIDGLALAFLISRIGFVAAYIGDKPTIRTLLWNVAMSFNIGIFFASGYGARGAIVATSVGLVFALAVAILLSASGSKRLER